MTEGATALRAIDLALAAIPAGGDDLNVHVGTALMWIEALDGWWLKRPGYDGGDRSDAALLLDGARFARNAVAHGLVVAVRPGGLTFPATIPFTFPRPSWRTLDEVLADWPTRQVRTGKGRDQAQRDGYRDHFQARAVLPVLTATVDWLRAHDTV